MAEISKEPRILVLEKKLEALLHDFRAVEALFTDHATSGFTERFLQQELFNVSRDPNHIVRNVVGQTNINVINSQHFDYSVKLQVPVESKQHQLKWMGASQLLVIKGSGSLTVRVLQVPSHLDINHFEVDVALQVQQQRELRHGDSIAGQGPHQILEIVQAAGTVLIESLTIKNTQADIFWTFNEQGRSFIAESSKVTMSRLINILNVATQTVARTPAALYDTIFAFGDPNLKLKAIQQLLSEGNHAAFAHLQQAIDDPNEFLSEGAQTILARLVNTHS
jgi:hypothetical protein